MDTISRENNSILPVGGAIVGVVALLLGLYSAVVVSKVKTQVANDQPKIDQIDDLSSQVSSAAAAADKAGKDIATLTQSTQDAVNSIATRFGTDEAKLGTLEEQLKRPVRGLHGAGGAVVAGPGEYVVQSGDTGHKIARAQGVSVRDLLAVNPDVDWKHLKVGQKIKLPEKKQ